MRNFLSIRSLLLSGFLCIALIVSSNGWADEQVSNSETSQSHALARTPALLSQPDQSPVRNQGSSTSRSNANSARAMQFGRLIVVTNFQKAEVTVNELPYPSFVELGEPEGMKLPAGGPHAVVVTFDGKAKYYDVYLRPNETRYLMVELTGYQGGAAVPRPVARTPQPATPRPTPRARQAREEQPEEDNQGEVTVYSRPRGEIMIGGQAMGQHTPGSVKVENGRHEVQVRYEDGEISEKKIVRVRESSRIKLYFRQQQSGN